MSKGEGGLGFRDIHAFNLAMLAKQGWRLLMNPESLCAQLLKAKYFPNGSVLQAKAKSNMSYSWRSILSGIDVLKKGLIWRVGDGSQIRIWEDPWLPRGHLRQPCTPRGANLLTRVDELLDPSTGTWDEELVRDCFWKEDADLILSLPVHEGMDDMIAWYYNSNGLFSVKSAYKVEIADRQRGLRDRGQPSSSALNSGEDDCWKKLWKIRCPKKMIHFLWRLGHSSLAVRVNLWRRGLKLDTLCVQCGRLDEDGARLFFKCKKVKLIWAELQLDQIRTSLATTVSAKAAIVDVIKLKEESQRLVITLLYTWWSERCAVRVGERPRSSSQLAQLIRSYTEECSIFDKIRTLTVPCPTKPIWCKHPRRLCQDELRWSF